MAAPVVVEILTPLISRLKNQISSRWPKAVMAYHLVRYRDDSAGMAPARTLDGFLFAGRPDMQAGTFEPDEMAFVRRHLEHSSLFVDVGANSGLFTCLARSAGRKIVAVEPSAVNVQALCRNLLLNDWRDVEVFPVALDAQPGIATLYGEGTGASLVPNWSGTSAVWQRAIPVSTLDRLVGERFSGESMLIKIDVEGSEFAVLNGAGATLTRSPRPVWLVEVCLTEHHPDGVNPHFVDVFTLFDSHGYEARTIEPEPRVVAIDDVRSWAEARHRSFGSVTYSFHSK